MTDPTAPRAPGTPAAAGGADDSEPGAVEKRFAVATFTGWIVVIVVLVVSSAVAAGLVALVWVACGVVWLRLWFGRLRRLRRAAPGHWTDLPRGPAQPGRPGT